MHLETGCLCGRTETCLNHVDGQRMLILCVAPGFDEHGTMVDV